MSDHYELLQILAKAEFIEDLLSEKKRVWGDRDFPDDIYLMLEQINTHYGSYKSWYEEEFLNKLNKLSERIQEVMDIWAGNNLA